MAEGGTGTKKPRKPPKPGAKPRKLPGDPRRTRERIAADVREYLGAHHGADAAAWEQKAGEIVEAWKGLDKAISSDASAREPELKLG